MKHMLSSSINKPMMISMTSHWKMKVTVISMEIFLKKNFNMREDNYTERRNEQNRRSSVVDRRLGLDRRRGPGRRLTDDRKSAEEGQMSEEQFAFVMAIDEYKKKNSRPFPTWTEVLEVIKALG